MYVMTMTGASLINSAGSKKPSGLVSSSHTVYMVGLSRCYTCCFRMHATHKHALRIAPAAAAIIYSYLLVLVGKCVAICAI